jgi:hypothetical protein
MPALRLRYLDRAGTAVAEGTRRQGGREGVISVPLEHRTARGQAVEACLSAVRAKGPIAIAGEGFPTGAAESERVSGQSQPGRISLYYLRARPESWWQMLPTLSRRFGLGKAGFFGVWLLPLAAAVLLGVWVATFRLLTRQLS